MKWWQSDKIIVIPLVLSPTAVVCNMPNQSPTTLDVPPCLLSQVSLNTCSKVRKFLSDAVHLNDEEADNPECIIFVIRHAMQNPLTQPPNRYTDIWSSD